MPAGRASPAPGTALTGTRRLLALLAAATAALVLAPAAGAGTGSTTIRIDPEGSGDGSVIDAAAGIFCFYAAGTANGAGITCDYELAHGATVALVATASPGSVLVKWIVCPGTVAGSTCTFVVPPLPDVLVVEARFEIQRTLTVSVSGAGTVTSSPAGVSCPGDCSETTTGNVAVTLTATPAPGSRFAGWGGDCAPAGLTATCPLSMLQNRTVTASFAPVESATLTVALAGEGDGGVTSAPPGIACGSDCSETVVAGTPVTLTAEAAPGSAFAGWSGACTGAGACTVTVAGQTAVTAAFERLPVDARLLSASVVRRGSWRAVRVRIDAGGAVSVRLRLERGGRVLASRRVRSLPAGTSVVALPLRRGVKAGGARLVVALADASGSRSVFVRTVRLPPPA